MKTIRHTLFIVLVAIMLTMPTCFYVFINNKIPDSLVDALILLGIQMLWIQMMIKREVI